MENVTIQEAKNNLTSLIERVLNGEEIIITRRGEPIVTIEKIKKNKSKRIGGQFKGQITMADDFDNTPDDFVKHFQ